MREGLGNDSPRSSCAHGPAETLPDHVVMTFGPVRINDDLRQEFAESVDLTQCPAVRANWAFHEGSNLHHGGARAALGRMRLDRPRLRLCSGSTGGRWRCPWRRPVRLRDDAGTPGISPFCPLLTPPESGFSMYGYGNSDGPGFPASAAEFGR